MKLGLFTPAAHIFYILESAEGGHVSQAKNLASLEAFCIFTDVGLLDNIMWQWCGNVLKTKLLIMMMYLKDAGLVAFVSLITNFLSLTASLKKHGYLLHI